MPTVFESISDGFYTAFFEPDQDKRKDKIEAWIKESTPVIQSAVENDLRAYLEEILTSPNINQAGAEMGGMLTILGITPWISSFTINHVIIRNTAPGIRKAKMSIKKVCIDSMKSLAFILVSS